MVWTRIMDMHSGGGPKEDFEHLYIEAPEDEAGIIFYNRFGHSVDRVSCTCCGPDYSLDESETLEEATAYNRNCAYEDGRYVEKQEPGKLRVRRECNTKDDDPWGLYVPLNEYLKSSEVRVIRATEIKPAERRGSVPKQGFVWVD